MKIGSCVLVAMTDHQAISSLESFSAFEKHLWIFLGVGVGVGGRGGSWVRCEERLIPLFLMIIL